MKDNNLKGITRQKRVGEEGVSNRLSDLSRLRTSDNLLNFTRNAILWRFLSTYSDNFMRNILTQGNLYLGLNVITNFPKLNFTNGLLDTRQLVKVRQGARRTFSVGCPPYKLVGQGPKSYRILNYNIQPP